MLANGAEQGDRVILVAANSSRFVRTWVGSSVAGLVEVPINTAYEHDFLAHQVRTVEARLAVIDDVFAERFVAVSEAARDITKFWVIDTGQQDKAIEVLREAGWDAAPWDELERTDRPPVQLPEVHPQDLASVLFTSGTTGPSQGRRDAARSDVLLRRRVRLARPPHPGRRVDGPHPALPRQRPVHGRVPDDGGGREVRGAVAGSLASRWVDQLRESRVTVTNFIGVMMDFIWKQDPREDDADNPLRVVFAAPTAASLVQPMKDRYGIEAFVEVFGLTETSAPIISPYGEDRPAGAAGLAADEWFDVALVDPETDEEVAVGEIGELVIRPKVPFICSMGYFNMPGQDRRGLAQPVVPHR